MDWSKAKNILIAALLITNLMLGMAIHKNINGSGSAEQEEIKQNAILLLENHGIYVEEELIPDRTERLPVLSVRYRTVSQDVIDAAIASRATALSANSTEDEYRRTAEEVLKAAGMFHEGCVFESATRDGRETVLIFGTEYEGYPLDNAKIHVSFWGGEVEEVSSHWAEPVSMGQNRKRVLPAHEALIRFMTIVEEEARTQGITEDLREEIRVDQMRLVYWLEGYTENSGVSEDTAVPYWCIQYNDGESILIAAYEE